MPYAIGLKTGSGYRRMLNGNGLRWAEQAINGLEQIPRASLEAMRGITRTATVRRMKLKRRKRTATAYTT